MGTIFYSCFDRDSIILTSLSGPMHPVSDYKFKSEKQLFDCKRFQFIIFVCFMPLYAYLFLNKEQSQLQHIVLHIIFVIIQYGFMYKCCSRANNKANFLQSPAISSRIGV